MDDPAESSVLVKGGDPMSLLTTILGLPSVTNAIDKVIPDKDKQAELKFELEKLKLEDDTESRRVLKAMLGNDHWLVSGAIPALIWMASVMLFNNFVLLPWAEVFGGTVPEVILPSGYFNLLGVIIMGLFGKKAFDGNEIKFGSFYSPKK
jgi:hypothetical protein